MTSIDLFKVVKSLREVYSIMTFNDFNGITKSIQNHGVLNYDF